MNSRDAGFLSAILNAIPAPVFVVDPDVRVIEANDAARPLMGDDALEVYLRKGGEVLHCFHVSDAASGCGRGPECKNCIVRNSVSESFSDQKVVRRAARMILMRQKQKKDAYLLVTAAPLTFEGHRYVILTLEDINELVELRRLIPICANCKKIRNEQEYWDSVETYFKSHLDMDFTHGICPDCMHQLYPEIAPEVMRRHEARR